MTVRFIIQHSSFIIRAEMTPNHETHELLRKTLHIALGLCIVTLKFLPWTVAATIAAAAAVSNWLLLHRIFGKRIARHERGYDAGIVIYPLAVCALIIIFRKVIVIAAAIWAILAFGDGFATLAGKTIRGPRLPWNTDKTWSGFGAFIAFGTVGVECSYLLFRIEPSLWLVAGVTIVCAIVESLPLHVDDNFTVPLTGAAICGALMQLAHPPVLHLDPIWIGVNTLLAIAGYLAKSVDVSGAAGGWILGTIIIVFGGWHLYVLLLAFFVIGTAATKIGYRRKAKLEQEQEKGGRRGFSHAFSNVGMAALLAIVCAMSSNSYRFWLAGAPAPARAANVPAAHVAARSCRHRRSDLDRRNAGRHRCGIRRCADCNTGRATRWLDDVQCVCRLVCRELGRKLESQSRRACPEWRVELLQHGSRRGVDAPAVIANVSERSGRTGVRCCFACSDFRRSRPTRFLADARNDSVSARGVTRRRTANRFEVRRRRARSARCDEARRAVRIRRRRRRGGGSIRFGEAARRRDGN